MTIVTDNIEIHSGEFLSHGYRRDGDIKTWMSELARIAFVTETIQISGAHHSPSMSILAVGTYIGYCMILDSTEYKKQVNIYKKY